VFVLACVADIPASVTVDFSAEQLACMEAVGHCEVPFWPFKVKFTGLTHWLTQTLGQP
jgi:hypothetical protein